MIFSDFERQIAFRYLRAKRQEGFISIIAAFSFLGITLGVATLIIVMSVMNGFREELTHQILGFQSHITLYPARESAALVANSPGLKTLQEIPGVVNAIPIVERQTIVARGSQAAGAQLFGIRPRDFRLSDKLIAGTLEDFTGNTILLGARLAERLNVAPGDGVKLVSPQGTATPFGMAPKIVTFQVAGVFEVGMYQFDSASLFIPQEAAQRLFGLGEGIDAIQVYVTDPYGLAPVVNALRLAVGGDYRINDWLSTNTPFLNALDVESNVMFIILALIILVATFNVLSSMIMLVKDKGRDIAILRTMGASRAMILRIFFLTGSCIGVAGTLAGFTLGLAFAANIERIRMWIESLTGADLFNQQIYFFAHLPSKVMAGDVCMIVGLALLLSFMATLYPAWQAAKLDPVEALRYE